MPKRLLTISSAAGALFVSATVTVAAGEIEAPAPHIAAVVDGTGPVATRALIGASGELYRPDGVATYRRQALGGLAIDVLRAVPSSDNLLFALGERTPIFAFDGATWRQHRIGQQGDAQVAVGSGLPAIAIRRQVFVWNGHGWARAGMSRVPIHTLWAGSLRRIYIADPGGGVHRLDGRRWATIRINLPAGDRVSHLMGAPGRSLLAATEGGTILDLGSGRAAKPLALPAGLAHFRVTAACDDGRGRLCIGGVVGTAEAGPTGDDSANTEQTLAPPSDGAQQPQVSPPPPDGAPGQSNPEGQTAAPPQVSNDEVAQGDGDEIASDDGVAGDGEVADKDTTDPVASDAPAPSPASANRPVAASGDAALLALERGKLAQVDRRAVRAGDSIAACAADTGGGVLWVTRGGQAWIRDKQGEWRERVVDSTIPGRRPTSTGNRPARTR